MLDVRGCGVDAVNVEAGVAADDILASKGNKFEYIKAQENGRFGYYSGTRSNKAVVYGEANGVASFILDEFAAGNKVETTQYDTFTNLSSGSDIDVTNADADYKIAKKTKLQLAGGAGFGLRFDNTDGLAGILDFEKTAARLYEMMASGTSADQTVRIRNKVLNGSGDPYRAMLAIDHLTNTLPVPETHGSCTVTSITMVGPDGQSIRTGTGTPEGNLVGVRSDIFMSFTDGTFSHPGVASDSGWVAWTSGP
jgi:hypothetical protein